MANAATLPGFNQIRILSALRDGEDAFTVRDGAVAPGLATKAQVTSLINAGWAKVSDGALVLTSIGDTALGYAEGRAAYKKHSTDHGGDMSVQVTRRSRGYSPIAGRGKAPDGRNVECGDCYKVAQARHEAGETRTRPDRVVWFTNEGGAPAQRSAEVAAGGHILRHLSGEIEAP